MYYVPVAGRTRVQKEVIYLILFWIGAAFFVAYALSRTSDNLPLPELFIIEEMLEPEEPRWEV